VTGMCVFFSDSPLKGNTLSKLKLSLACAGYDRTRALKDGSVQPEGIDLNYLEQPSEETFFRMLRNQEFDVAELSLSSFMISLARPNKPFVAIPVFPSRFFRHSCIYVNTKSGIREPKDLIGKKVGTPEYQMTAAVWIRGTLADDFGVPFDSMTYYTGGGEQPGRAEKIKLNLPSNIMVERIGPTQTLAQMLLDGEIDALYTARTPSTFDPRGGNVVRMFPKYQMVELEYYRKTKIFPIMHLIAIRREVYEANRWIAQSLYKAFLQAQQLVYTQLQETTALRTMLPWQNAYVEETREEMGNDFWPYGIDANRHTLETLSRYSVAQGLTSRLFTPEELFVPEVHEAFKI
jgi:4,5-dihydroxyphthalate decarboxylase